MIENYLILDINKTYKMIADYRRTINKPTSIFILGEEVEVMEDYTWTTV